MNKYAALNLFGEMQLTTPREQRVYEDMLNKHSIPLGRSIWNMETEIDYCDICRKKTQVQRKYYHYDIDCECCGGDHFEIVRYCKDCEPHPPKYISAIVIPKELQFRRGKINPEYWEYYA